MGRQSPFTVEQRNHILSYIPAFEAILKDEKRHDIKEWKDCKTEEILASPLFKDKLSNNISMPTWRTVSSNLILFGRHF